MSSPPFHHGSVHAHENTEETVEKIAGDLLLDPIRMDTQDEHAGPAVTFKFHEGGPRIVYRDGSSSPLPQAAMRRSRLLRDLCESEALAGQSAAVNLSAEQVYTWLAFIEPLDEHSLAFASDAHLVAVLKVLDFEFECFSVFSFHLYPGMRGF